MRPVRAVRRGRPMGQIAQAVVERLERGPAAVWQLRRELQLSAGDARLAAFSLLRGGHVRYGAPAPQRPGGKPARLLVLARDGQQAGGGTGAAAMWSLPAGFFNRSGGNE